MRFKLSLVRAVALAGISLAYGGAGHAQAPSSPREDPQIGASWHQTQKVHALAQTPDGFLWAGTDSGLLRYDGTRFVTYTTGDGLRGNIVQALAVDRKGALWIGLAEGRGLARMSEGKLSSINTGIVLEKRDVFRLAADADSLWIGTHGGLYRMPISGNGEVTPVATVTGQILAVHTRDNVVWVGSSEGLFLGDKNGFRSTGVTGLILDIVTDHAGTVWFSSSEQGLMKIEGDHPPVVALNSAPSQGSGASSIAGFTALAVDREGDLWVGWGWGHAIFKNGVLGPRFTTALHTVDILPDAEGGVWTATYWGVVSRYARPRVRNQTFTEAGEAPIVFSITHDNDNGLWMTLPRSVVRLTGNERRSYAAGKDFPYWCPRSLSAARAGGVWMASCDRGVLRIDGDQLIPLPFAGEVPRGGQSIFEDSEGQVWLGLDGGALYRSTNGILVEQTDFPNDRCNTDTSAPNVKNNRITLDECAHSVTDIINARDGGIWVSLRRNGLRRLKNGKWTSWKAGDGLPSESLIALYEDPAGVLWIGTQASGLLRFANGRFQSVQKRDGLPAQSIHGIVQDDRGRMWMSSERGIFRIASKELDAFFSGQTDRVNGFAYDPRDGLESFVTLQSFPDTIAFFPDGTLAVPMDMGLATIDTHRVDDVRGFSPALIETIRIEGRSFQRSMPAEIDLSFGNNKLGSIEFHFNVPNFEVPHRIDTQYRLIGHDSEWRKAGNERVVRYENLAPGNYQLELQPYMDDTPFGPTLKSDSVYLRSFYRRPLFFLLLGLSLLPLLAAAYVVRMRYHQVRFNTVLAERNRIARDLHDSLAQYFTGIAYQLERLTMVLRKDPDSALDINEETKLMLAQCRLEARQAIHNMRQESVAQDSFSDSLRAVAAETRISGTAMVDVAVSGPERGLPTRLQRELLRIAQEATVNALAHAKATLIELRVTFSSDSVSLTITDNGTGFDSGSDNKKPLHYGLQGMRERAAALGGEFHLESKASVGTTIIVSVQIPE
jgi:signal transduction histidine kinase/ligand-binding sensor domain-containing protein